MTAFSLLKPYIYQDEDKISDAERRNRANNCDPGMADCVYNAMRNKTGKWVRYDENGKMLRGWVTIDGTRHYFNEITGVLEQ